MLQSYLSWEAAKRQREALTAQTLKAMANV